MGRPLVHLFAWVIRVGHPGYSVRRRRNSRNQKALKKVLSECLLPDFALPASPSIEKFALLADLGVITVPADYVHGTRLTSFRAKHQDGETKSFYRYNDALTDANFPNPGRILEPGDRLRVRAFKQVIRGATTSLERMAFLETQKAIYYTGAQGASLVWEQKRDKLPKGYWYSSFDEEERLWRDAHDRYRVPFVSADSDGDFSFNLGHLEVDWNCISAFVSFCEEPLITTREITAEEFAQMIEKYDGIHFECEYLMEDGTPCKYSKQRGGNTRFLNKKLVLQLLAPGNSTELLLECNHCGTPQRVNIQKR